MLPASYGFSGPALEYAIRQLAVDVNLSHYNLSHVSCAVDMNIRVRSVKTLGERGREHEKHTATTGLAGSAVKTEILFPPRKDLIYQQI
jgi:hypothetical protein